MSVFIPGFHFLPASQKLTKEWCWDVLNYYWFNYKTLSLLHNKNVKEIEGYANGDFSLAPFQRMFRSMRKKQSMDGDSNIAQEEKDKLDKTGIQWDRVASIPSKLNSAVATLQKIPIEITATCIDPLAHKKKNEDLEFLRNKAKMEQELQPYYDGMNLGPVDLGTTQHSSIPFKGMPLDLDVDNEEEFRIVADLAYNLASESAFEVILKSFSDVKKLSQISYLETFDQFKYAVSVHQALHDENTGLPNIEYQFPGAISTDESALPDYSDNIIRTIRRRVTPNELFKYFPNEICDEKHLNSIVNFSGADDWIQGYSSAWKGGTIPESDFNTYKMNLIYVEVKSVDYAMIAVDPDTGIKHFTNDETTCTSKIWGQNTYCFYWLENTRHFFGKNRLGFAYRGKGSEIYTGFTTNIYRSAKRSAVEHCIGENKKQQIADIKLQHTLIKSKPSGGIQDIKYYRNVIDTLKDNTSGYTITKLMQMAEEDNWHVISTQGYEGVQSGQQNLPFRELPGGLKDDILGYYRVQLESDKKIDAYLSTNPQLTGQGATTEGLVGLQKLLIASAINGIYYATEAKVSQLKGLFNVWAYYIKEAIRKGGAAKQAIINIIGTRKMETLKGLDDIPLHQIAFVITLGQREEEKAVNKMRIEKLENAGILNSADIYWIDNTQNPKDAAWIIAVKQTRFMKKAEQEKIRAQQSQEKIKQMEGQNMLAQSQATTEGKAALIEKQGDVDSRLMQLATQLGLTKSQMESLYKRQLQKERLDGQRDKSIQTILASNQQKNQQPFQ